jgi:PAS domain S-box-containing protein
MDFTNTDMKPSENEHYKSLLDSIPDMVSIIELIYNEKGQPIDFYIRDLNLPFAKLLNKTKQELLNKKITLITSAFEDKWLNHFASTQKTGHLIEFKSYSKKLDNHYFITSWKISKNKVGISFISITESEKEKKTLKLESLKLEKTIKELDKTVQDLNNQKKEQKEQRANELIIAKKELAYQQEEKSKRANEKKIANKELNFQKEQKELRANELVIANKELAYQQEEKSKRANEKKIANKELNFQKEQKEQRANELVIANKEKKERLKELVIARELKQFIETSNTPVFGIDKFGSINEWNLASKLILGYNKNEIIGINWLSVNQVSENKAMSKVIKLALKGQQSNNFEFQTKTKKGNQVVLLINANTRWNEHGEIQGVLAVAQDITELVGYRNELEKKVEERTLKLNQALEKQKDLNKLKTKFVSTASHEFRTPLSAINFAAGSIKRYWGKMEKEMVIKKLDKIEHQVEHMTGLLDNILIVGQADANELKNNPLKTHLGDFIEDIIEEVYISKKKSHKIELIDTENIKNTHILLDKKLGRSIFTNLISNAIKYSASGKKIIIEVSTEKKYFVISVTDFGVGIAPQELKTIFTPFTRGKNVELIQGTGLGLSIAKEAASVMKGKIIVKSTVDKGSSFIVKIPK